jgi:tetratricopeptide (TPR) repeat protein
LLALFGQTWTDVPRTPHPLADYWRDWSARFAGSMTLKRLISGELFAGLSRYRRARELFEAAATDGSTERDLAEIQLARMLIRSGEPGAFAAAEAAAQRAVDFVRAGTPFAQARAWHELGYIKYKRGQYADALLWLDQVLALPPDREILPYVMSSTHDKGVVLQDLGRHAEALPLLQRGLDLSWELGNFTHVAWSLHHIGLHHLYLGELAEARAIFVEARRTGSAIGDLNYVATVDHELALLDFFGGNVRGSIATLEAALATGATTGSGEFDGTDLQHLGIAWLELGELDRADELFAQAEESYAAVENAEDAAELLCYRVDLELQRHACADADAALTRAKAHQPQTPDYRVRIDFMHALADVLCRGADAGPLVHAIEQAAAESRRYLLLDLVDLAARFRCGDPAREPFRTACQSIAATYARAGNVRRAERIDDFLRSQ